MKIQEFRHHYKDNLSTTIDDMVQVALEEDLNLATGGKDITAELIPIEKQINAKLISRETGILCGKAWFNACFEKLDSTITLNWHLDDGDSLTADHVLCDIQGSARHILSAERSAMNFLQTLSATASATNNYVRKIAHTKCQLLDTRKTLPGFRIAQKYAVLCGGGANHRMGLFDAYLIKENHIRSCGGISQAVTEAQRLNPNCPIEVEVETISELETAIAAGADIVMLDNFPLSKLMEAVAINNGQCKLEASGNITLETITDVAETDVDYISVGAITKNISAIDLSLLVSED